MIAAAGLFLQTFWRPIAIALAIAAAWWWHSGQVAAALDAARADGRAEVQKKWDKAKTDQAAVDASANQLHRTTERLDRDRTTTAQNQRAQTAGADAAAVAGLRTERDRLRSSLGTALNAIRSCDLPGPAADAAARHAATVESVLADMENEGAGMAGAASGHAADSLMYQQAWPKGAP